MDGERIGGAAFGLLLLVGCGQSEQAAGDDSGSVNNTARTSGGTGGSGGARGTTPGEASIVFIDPLPEHVEAAEAVIGGRSQALVYAASADRQVLVGVSDVSTDSFRRGEVFRWTRAGGKVSLGWLSDDPQQSGTATFGAMSADGSVIVGSAPDVDSVSQAFRWTEQTGLVALGPLTPSYALLSDDGAAVAYSNGSLALRWTEDSGLQALTPLFEDASHTVVAIHPDGTRVFGQTVDGALQTPWRWTAQSGTEAIALPDGVDSCLLSDRTRSSYGSALVLSCAEGRSLVYLPESGVFEVDELEGYPLAWISAVSKDGSVVFGAGQLEGHNTFMAVRFSVETGTVALLPDQRSSSIVVGRETSSLDGSVAIGSFVADDGSDGVFRWEEGKGFIELLPPDGYERPEVAAVRPDGAWVVGNARLDNEKVPVIWDRTGAPHVLASYLGAAGLDLGDSVLIQATFMSETGMLFGSALQSSRRVRAFVATLP